MLLQAAIEIANAERWALERGEPPRPAALAGMLRTTAYEVTVVDAFHRIARRHFERGSFRSVWERPIRTGRQGRPYSIDVSLFRESDGTETRIELGLYTKAKLGEDADKLHRQSANGVLADYPTVINLLAFWEIKSTKLTHAEARDSMRRFKTDAGSVSGGGLTVSALLASSVDLFVAETGDHRHATVGLFELV